MTVIEVEDLVGPCAITLLSSIQMGNIIINSLK